MPNELGETHNDIALMRLPVFDKKHRIWGYELLDPDIFGGPSSSFAKEKTAALDLVGGAYIGVQQLLDKGKHIILSLDDKDLLARLPYAFPPEHTTIKVTESFYLVESVPETITTLFYDVIVRIQMPAQIRPIRRDLEQYRVAGSERDIAHGLLLVEIVEHRFIILEGVVEADALEAKSGAVIIVIEPYVVNPLAIPQVLWMGHCPSDVGCSIDERVRNTDRPVYVLYPQRIP